LWKLEDELLQQDGFGLGGGVVASGGGGDVQALSLDATAFLGHEVGGDPEKERLRVADLASGLVGRDAEVGLLNDVVDARDA